MPLSRSRPAPYPAGKQTADMRVRNPRKDVAVRARGARQMLGPPMQPAPDTAAWPLEKACGQGLITASPTVINQTAQ